MPSKTFEDKFKLSTGLLEIAMDFDVDTIKDKVNKCTHKMHYRYHKYLDYILAKAIIDNSVNIDTKQISIVFDYILANTNNYRLDVEYTGRVSIYRLYETKNKEDVEVFSITVKRIRGNLCWVMLDVLNGVEYTCKIHSIKIY